MNVEINVTHKILVYFQLSIIIYAKNEKHFFIFFYEQSRDAAAKKNRYIQEE